MHYNQIMKFNKNKESQENFINRFTENYLYNELLRTHKKPHYSTNKKDFELKVIDSYSRKSNKMLEFHFYNLLSMKNTNTNKYIFDLKDFVNKYLRKIDDKDNLKFSNLIIEDKDNNFLKEKEKSYVNKTYSKVNTLDYLNKNKKCIFITFTNPSEFHYYDKYGQINSKCKNTFEENIIKSVDNMNDILRYFYNQLKKYLGRKGKDTKFDFYKVFEYHKSDYSIHSHTNLYLDKDTIKIAKHIYKQVINKFNLEQTKFIVLRTAKSSSYIMKYLLKYSSDTNNFYTKYKRYLSNYRFFTTSRLNKPMKQIETTYNYLKMKKPKLLNRLKGLKTPLYINLMKYIDYKLTFEYEEKTTHRFNPNEIFNYINKRIGFYKWKIYRLGKSTHDIMNYYHRNKEDIVNHILDNLKKETFKEMKYKKISKVYVTKTNELIYDNNLYKKTNENIEELLSKVGIK